MIVLNFYAAVMEPSVTEQALLSVDNFSKSFFLHEQNKRIPSASNVSLSVFPGKLTALVGPTGAGKSSVLKGIYGTYLAGSGKILYRTAANEEVDLAQAAPHRLLDIRRHEIAFVTQFLHVLPRQSCEEVVAQPLMVQGVARQDALERARTMLAALNVPEALWGIAPATFSGGEKQRVNLARGFVFGARLLLLDEPTASLDPYTTELVVAQLQKLKQQGVAMLAIFHQPELVERLADSLVELKVPVVGSNAKKEHAYENVHH